MSYRGMTFCSFYQDCTHGMTCRRSLTPEVLEGAQKWGAAFGAPISQFAEKPECWHAIPSGEEPLINALTKAGAVFVEVKSTKKDIQKLQKALDAIESMSEEEYTELHNQAKDLPNIVVIPYE